jgi:hypothetical protein
MNHWQKESLGLQVGDTIICRDEAVELEGQPAVVTPGMKGEVISLHDGFHLDVAQVKPIPPRARVRFESITLMVDERMRWERVADAG